MPLFKNSLKPIILLCLLFLSTIGKSQTTLTAGDIAFSGYVASYNAPTPDEFSFVLLKNITAGTVINFTDNGWLSTNVFRTGETTITWTSTAALVAGKEIKIAGTTATIVGGGAAGTVTGTALSLSVNGDQILAYQGTAAAPTFISGIHMNVYVVANGDPTTTTAAAWDGTANTTNASALPTGLTTGTNAIWIGTQNVATSERNNGRFTCGPNVTTVALTRAALNNQVNWQTEFAASGATPSFTLPTGCNYLGVSLPVKLISFSAVIKNADVEINWKTADELNLGHYEVERSYNGREFIPLKNISSISSTGVFASEYSYSTIDMNPFAVANSIIYYRVKSVDLDGRFEYSGIVRVNQKKSITALAIDYLVNPIQQQSIQLSLTANKNQSVQIQLYNLEGKLLHQFYRYIQKGSNAIMLSVPHITRGIYTLKVSTEDGLSETRQLLKQ